MVIEISVEQATAQRDDDALEVLLRRIATQDRAAFAELYDLVAPRLNGVIVTMLPGRASEDVLSEAFLCVWSETSTTDVWRGAATSWLFSIVHRCAARAARAAGDEDADRLVQEPAVSSATLTGLDALEPDERRVVDLAYRCGLDELRIAARLGLSKAAVRSTLRSAMRSLRSSTTGFAPGTV